MKINLANIKKAQKLLNKNECVAIPTETVYGLAGNAYSDKACKKIYKIKKLHYGIHFWFWIHTMYWASVGSTFDTIFKC